MLFSGLVVAGAVVVLLLIGFIGRAAGRALRAFVTSCWPQS
jgi:hypothetical protein